MDPLVNPPNIIVDDIGARCGPTQMHPKLRIQVFQLLKLQNFKS
jgi:hypothetical protein